MADKQGQQSTYKYGIDPDKFHGMIAERAYCKAKQRGFAEGHELDDWLEAEKEVNKQCFYWFQDEE